MIFTDRYWDKPFRFVVTIMAKELLLSYSAKGLFFGTTFVLTRFHGIYTLLSPVCYSINPSFSKIKVLASLPFCFYEHLNERILLKSVP